MVSFTPPTAFQQRKEPPDPLNIYIYLFIFVHITKFYYNKSHFKNISSFSSSFLRPFFRLIYSCAKIWARRNETDDCFHLSVYTLP
jgi:hypothetical protein